jgi:hypothetical protein
MAKFWSLYFFGPSEAGELVEELKIALNVLGCSNEIHLLINSALTTFDVWEKAVFCE